MAKSPSLLMVMAVAAGVAAAANASEAADSKPKAAAERPTSSLGRRIGKDIASQREDLQRRSSELESRERAAKALEAKLKAKSSEQQEAQATAKAEKTQAADAPDPREDRYKQLAAIYQAMKPAKAAPVFEQLDLEVQVGVARLMRERATAGIMASMQAEKAAKLSMALAKGNGFKGMAAK